MINNEPQLYCKGEAVVQPKPRQSEDRVQLQRNENLHIKVVQANREMDEPWRALIRRACRALKERI